MGKDNHLFPFEKEVTVKGNPIEPSGADSAGHHPFEPLPTREPMLSPFHAYSIPHFRGFVKGFSKSFLDFFENFFGEREGAGAVIIFILFSLPVI